MHIKVPTLTLGNYNLKIQVKCPPPLKNPKPGMMNYPAFTDGDFLVTIVKKRVMYMTKRLLL
jgi:hypothetical protein